MLPMRTVSGGKARLGEALDAEEREELVLGLLLHTLAVLADWPRCGRVHLVSPDPVLAAATRQAGADVIVHRQPGEGLNEGIRMGIGAAMRAGRGEPCWCCRATCRTCRWTRSTSSSWPRMPASRRRGADRWWPSRHPTRAAARTRWCCGRRTSSHRCFGSDSFEAHLRAAEAAGAAVQVVSHPVLGFDLDTPEDLERLDPTRLRS